MKADRPGPRLPAVLGGAVLLALACGTLSTPAPAGLPTPPPAAGTSDPPAPTPTAPVSTQTSSPPTVTGSPYRSDFPDPAAYQWLPVASGLSAPVDLQNAGDGSGRLFVVEKPGRIRILLGGYLLAQPFLDITARVGDQGSEQGLLGLAFHPDFTANGYVYVNYTDPAGDTVVSRFRVGQGGPDMADPASETVLLRVDQPYANHNGGGLAFGPDGLLYIGLGDGGAAGDPAGNAQSDSTYLGKFLRLDVDLPGALPEIWASGLRNPWRYAFDALTGDLYIADVGQNAWEEIDFVPAGSAPGLNFGWDYFEGLHAYEGRPPGGLDVVWPVAEYPHSEGCSITGGVVYRGAGLPEWQGVYLYADYCSGLVSGLIRSGADAWQTAGLFATGMQVSTFGVDEQGEVYLADLASGTVSRLVRR